MKPVIIAGCLALFLSGCALNKSKPNNAATPAPTTEVSESPSATPKTVTSVTPTPNATANDQLHTPAKGDAEREAILDPLRAEVKRETGVDVIFVVNFLKVHNGWAWVDVTPDRKNGTALYEGKIALMHNENGVWRSMRLPPNDDEEDRMFGDLSRKYIRKIQTKYPSVPLDIFPKPED